LLGQRSQRALWRNAPSTRYLSTEARDRRSRNARHSMNQRPRCAIAVQGACYIRNTARELRSDSTNHPGANSTEQLAAGSTNQFAANLSHRHAA